MATVHRGGAREQYYEREIADDRELYYVGDGGSPGGDGGEPVGRWAGSGAAALGLSGPVDIEALRQMWEGRVPGSGEQLRLMPREGAVSALDLTFRPPKSVSVMFALADPEVRASVSGAHDGAVDEALGYLEREACFVRRGHAGAVREPGAGFVVAAFQHHSSRAGDPLLHTHAVVANMAEGPDGRWTALDGRALFGQAKTAGFLYQAALRAKLSQELGVEWSAVRNGTAEVEGVPRAVIDHFSQRRAQVLEAMAVEGGKSSKSAQLAAIRTRRAKRDVEAARQREEWRSRAAEFGLDRAQVQALVRAREIASPSRSELVAEVRRMAGPQGVTSRQSTFDRRDVLRRFATFHRAGASVDEIERIADEWLASEHVREVEAGRLDGGSVIRRGDGKVAPAYFGLRYSTVELLEVERGLIETAKASRGRDLAVADKRAVTAALADRPSVRGEQAAAVRALCLSGDGVQVLLGRPGAGKTFALAAAREAWETSAVPVYGSALSASAARVLETQAGIPSRTVAQLRGEIERWGGLDGAMTGGVLVVDEAGMVGTRDLAMLVDAAQAQGIALKLVGDPAQLPEIDAGGALRGLAERLGAVELREVQRQRDPQLRLALEDLRAGKGGRYLSGAVERGAVTIVRSPEAQRQAAIDHWWTDAQQHGLQSTVLLAARHVDRRELNGLARERMGESGLLGDRELEVGSRVFAAGDRVVALRNHRELGLLNGDRGTVQEIGRDGALTVGLDRASSVEVPVEYTEAGHLDLGYALTVHKAQGQTFERAHFLGDETVYRELAYTAATRGREETRFYVVAPDPGRGLAGHNGPSDVLQGIGRAIGRSQAKELAVDVEERAGEARQAPESELRIRADTLDDLLDVQQRMTRGAERMEEIEGELASAEERLARTREEIAGGGRRARRDPALRIRESGDCDAVERWREKLQLADHDVSRVSEWWDRARGDVGEGVAARVELARREHEHAREAVRAAPHEPAEHVIELIGPRPSREVGAWDEAARRIEAYHQTHSRDANTIEVPVGNAPREQQDHWEAVAEAVTRARGDTDWQQVVVERARDLALQRDLDHGLEL